MALYLVTGGAGFIGSNIVAGLSERGHRTVVSDWLGQDERWRNLAKHPPEDVIRPERLAAWLSGPGRAIDAVIHMGAISATTETDVNAIVENNIRLTNDLWDWCTAEQKPFLFASSAATYGDGANGFADDDQPEDLVRLLPLNAYGFSKHLIDCRIARIMRSNGPRPPQWAAIKFFNVYGPNEYHKGSMMSVIARNTAAVTGGEPMRLFRSYRSDYADGGQLRDFVYVRDCVDVIAWLLEHSHVSGLFNLGTGEARSWMDLAQALFAALGLPEKIEFIAMPESLRPKYQYFTQAKMDKLRSAGYGAPFTSLENGVRDYVQNYLMRDDPYR